MGIKADASKLAVVRHPGITLSEKLQQMGMSIKEFALRTSKPEKTIIAVISGKSAITTEMAVSFENVTKITASYWINKQRMFDEYLVRKSREVSAALSSDWMRQFPVSELVKRNWIQPCNSIEEKVQSLFNFFGISTEKAWADYYLNQKLKIAFRISLSHINDPHAMSCWLRQGELQAMEMSDIPQYSETRLKSMIPEIKNLMREAPEDFFSKLQTICAECGIKLIPTPCFPKAPISGATRWLNDVPVIQLSDRYKRYDSFCFSFFHEIGHILLHGKKDIFLEDAASVEMEDVIEKEKQADNYAANALLPKETEKAILTNQDFSIDAINNAASRYGIHPSIIIGRLHHLKIIPHWEYQDIIPKVKIS